MGSCFSKKPKKIQKEDKPSCVNERKVSKSCTPEPNMCSSIELVFENQSSIVNDLVSKSPSILCENLNKSGSAKVIINTIHRSQKPREDLNEVQSEILKATQFVERKLKTSKSTNNHQSLLLKRFQSEKFRSTSKQA